jgi:hypothetical protein
VTWNVAAIPEASALLAGPWWVFDAGSVIVPEKAGTTPFAE